MLKGETLEVSHYDQSQVIKVPNLEATLVSFIRSTQTKKYYSELKEGSY